MLRRIFYLVFLLTFTWAGSSLADDKGASADTSRARFKELEKGPKTIDVSKYPKEMQENYKIFDKACSKCHSLARPINSNYALPDEWERYIKRMKRKPGSGIGSKEAKAIYEFLVYDSQVRKKELYEKKLKEQEATGQTKEKTK
jgi:cytochrome c5